MLNRTQTQANLAALKKSVRFESAEDEGAAQYLDEIQSVLDALFADRSDEEVRKAAAWVGLESELVVTE